MLSNKLTFSLASLVVLLAFAVVATTVVAAPGGPTVTITEYSGLDDPNAAASATNVAHVQERDDFRVKITFGEAVTGFDDNGDVEVLASVSPSVLYTADVPVDETDVTELIPVTTPATDIGKVWVLVIDISNNTDYTYSSLRVRVPADMAQANDDATGNQQGTNTFNPPKGTPYTIDAALDATTLTAADLTDGKLIEAAVFNVKFTASGATGAIALPVAQIQILDKDEMDVSAEYDTLTNPIFTNGVATVSFDVATGTTPTSPVTIRVNPNYAAGTAATVPTATSPAAKPTVDISLVMGSLDETAMTFKVRFTFSTKTTMTASDIVVQNGSYGCHENGGSICIH
jgi:hypothetical protein